MTGSDKPDLSTRTQRIVKFVSRRLDDDPQALARLKKSARPVGLPAMIQRNGVLQTLAFLETKDDETDLLKLLRGSLGDVAPKSIAVDFSTTRLAALDARAYLLMQELAIETAAWIYRLIEARRQ